MRMSKMVIEGNEKRCPKCRKWKPLHCFHNSRQSSDKLTSYCKLCVAATQKDRQIWIRSLATKNAELTAENGRLRQEKVQLIGACKAALAYDKAVESCANDSNKMTSYCTAEGETLDRLYANWISKSIAALSPDVPESEAK